MKTLKEYYDLKLGKHYCKEYNDYIDLHTSNVKKAFEENFLPFYPNLSESQIAELKIQIDHHDESKWSDEEYDAYVDKFYPDGTKSEDEIHDNFAYAWLHHLHNNPHHPQYWFLRNDKDHDEDRMLDMPFNYIVEMLCDWGSFVFMNEEKKPGVNPNSTAHNWFTTHGDGFGFSENTLNTIKDILEKCPNL